MKFRKFLCMLLMASLVLSSNVYAAEDNSGGGIASPMYTNMTAIASCLLISDGTAYCSGSYKMTENKKSEIVMTLLRSDGTTAYTAYKTWSATNSGINIFMLDRFKTITKGYKYRVRVVINVYSGSTLVESGACYSKIISY